MLRAIAGISGTQLSLLASSLNYQVPGDVTLLKQDGNTCWANTATMMFNWRNKQSMSVSELMSKAGSVYSTLYRNREPLPAREKPGLLLYLGIKAEGPQSFAADGFDSLLRSK